MGKEFVPYEIALALKELGLKVKTPYWYNPNGVLLQKSFECDEDTTAVTIKDVIEYWDDVIKDRIDVPTYSQAFRWFREKYGLYSWIQLHNGYINDSFYPELPITFSIMDRKTGNKYYERDIQHNYLYKTNEEAELACLNKLIEIVEQK
jgi:hypothetical protein